MQSIERYGIVALLFLVVTVVAVFLWESGDAQSPSVQAQERASKAGARPGVELASGDEDEGRARPAPTTKLDGQPLPALDDSLVSVSSRPKPLRRDLERERRANATEDAAARGRGPVAFQALQARQPEPLEASLGDSLQASSDTRTLEHGTRSLSSSERDGRATAPERGLERREPPFYVVQAKDTLSEIALRELGSSKRWQELVELNPGLDPRKLREGMRLRLPDGETESARPLAASADPRTTTKPSEASSAPPPDEKPKASASGGRDVRVQPGDSLWKIAARELGDGNRWREIAELNPKTNPDKLYVGALLTLPGGSLPTRPVTADASSRQTKTPAPASNSNSSRQKKGRVH